MLDEATRQVEARLQFMAQEKVLHEQLAALNVELTRARQQRLSAVQWETALPYVTELCAAVALCRNRVQECRGRTTDLSLVAGSHATNFQA
jgi:hypothetical protein